jgi:lipopolysaccharide transport system permease protein
MEQTVMAKSAVTRIRPPNRWETLDLGKLWRFRDLVLALASRDVTLRYRQTALGILWVVLQPLLLGGIFTFVFGTLAQFRSGPLPYFIFAFAGMAAWNLFAAVLTRAGTSLTGNAAMISKVWFPRLLLPLSAIPSALVDFGVAAVLLILLAAVSGTGIVWTAVLTPFWLLCLIGQAAGFGLAAAALAARYRDVTHILPVFTQLLLYASPVAYPASQVPEGIARTIYLCNPVAAALERFRGALFGVGFAGLREVCVAGAEAVVALTVGIMIFRQHENELADVI